jgi:uncharacterized membrane protein YeaQ/YmgE (transglycosylase-associated protein family)
MELLWTILIGFIAGALAKFIMPGRDPGGIIITTLLGIGGAVLFSRLGSMIGLYQTGEKAGLLGAVAGAVIILWLYKKIKGS